MFGVHDVQMGQLPARSRGQPWRRRFVTACGLTRSGCSALGTGCPSRWHTPWSAGLMSPIRINVLAGHTSVYSMRRCDLSP